MEQAKPKTFFITIQGKRYKFDKDEKISIFLNKFGKQQKLITRFSQLITSMMEKHSLLLEKTPKYYPINK